MMKNLNSTMPSQELQYKIEVASVSFHDDESGWSVFRARNNENSHAFTVVGHFPSLAEGEYFQLAGSWTNHKSFGKQFKAIKAISARPNSRSGIMRYLSSGLFKGIGEKTASKIVNHLGLQTFKVLDEDPERIKLIPKLGKSLASKVIKSWNSKKQSNEISMFLYHHGITGATAQKIIKMYENDTITFVSENPYRLIKDIRGIGFNIADKMAKSMGLAADHPQRVQEGIFYLLQQAEDQGHCFLETEQLCQALINTLKLNQENLATCLEANLKQLFDELRIFIVAGAKGGEFSTNRHYLADLYACELGFAQKIETLLGTPFSRSDPQTPAMKIRIDNWITQYCNRSSISLSLEQKSGVCSAVSNKVFILTGGPGVGKTTTANTIIRLLKAMGRHVLLCAPTGRAAQRMQEISGEPAKTIHRLLEWSAGERCFKRSEANPLTSDVVIVDEASMLDVRLAHHLVSAIAPGSQLILIGDVDQLPAVGPGNVLRDMINSSKIPFLVLDKVFRQAQASHIVRIAHQINKGEQPEFSHADISDCRFIACSGHEQMHKMLQDLLLQHLPDAGYDPKNDVQILTPMNKGDSGSIVLNQLIQDWLNPKDMQRPEKINRKLHLRPGDKVIQLVNNYELGVFNGDIGAVVATEVEGGKLLTQFGERPLSYEADQISELSLAYAITIHKSQGSEFPVVIMPISMSFYVMLQRNLIYTALTRAKKLAIFIGEQKALNFAINNNKSILRKTHLKHYLKHGAHS